MVVVVAVVHRIDVATTGQHERVERLEHVGLALDGRQQHRCASRESDRIDVFRRNVERLAMPTASVAGDAYQGTHAPTVPIGSPRFQQEPGCGTPPSWSFRGRYRPFRGIRRSTISRPTSSMAPPTAYR